MIERFKVRAPRRGLFEITSQIDRTVARSGLREGLCTVFVRHTSASLTIQENAAPEARADLEAWMDRQVPDGDPLFTHVEEGPDDMPSHVKASLTDTSIAIPVVDGRLALGTWQGLFLWEHRSRPRDRHLVVHLGE